jgi:branched-chain amino acid transport system permease protein
MTNGRQNRRLLAALGLTALVALFPALGGLFSGDQHEFYLQQLTWILIFGLFCMSLDFLVGIVGLVSLGHAAFFGLGAYLLVLLTPEYEAPVLLTAVPLVLLGVGAAALVIGALALRTSGIYFIMVTLAVGQMVYYLFNDSSLAGGSDGVFIFTKPTLTIGGATLLDFESKTQFFYACLGLVVACYALFRMVLAAPFGKVIRGIGVNEYRTRGLGYDVYFYKLVAFVLSAMVAGLAGLLAAAQYGFVNPSLLGWHMSGTALVTVILGGMGSLIGPVLGAFLVEILRHLLEGVTEHWLLPFGGLIILMVLVLPRGLAGLGPQLRGWLARRRAEPPPTPPETPSEIKEVRP